MKASEALRKGMGMVKGQAKKVLYDSKNDCACALGCMLLGVGIEKSYLDGKAEIDTDDQLQDYFLNARINYSRKFIFSIEDSNDGGFSLSGIAQRLEDIGE